MEVDFASLRNRNAGIWKGLHVIQMDFLRSRQLNGDRSSSRIRTSFTVRIFRRTPTSPSCTHSTWRRSMGPCFISCMFLALPVPAAPMGLRGKCRRVTPAGKCTLDEEPERRAGVALKEAYEKKLGDFDKYQFVVKSGSPDVRNHRLRKEQCNRRDRHGRPRESGAGPHGPRQHRSERFQVCPLPRHCHSEPRKAVHASREHVLMKSPKRFHKTRLRR
jgi:hypothetical protein